MTKINEISQVINPEFFKLNFLEDISGNISSVKINLQSNPVEFRKQMVE
jgi:hypothetical protein